MQKEIEKIIKKAKKLLKKKLRYWRFKSL